MSLDCVPDTLAVLKAIVSRAGGEWFGLQDTLNPAEAMIQFRSHASGRIINVPIDPRQSFTSDVLYAKVKAALDSHEQMYSDRKIVMKASELERIQKVATQIAEELDTILGRGKK